MLFRSNEGKYAVVASRKIGRAVARNKCKRTLREVFRKHKSDFTNSYDYIMIAKKNLLSDAFQDIEENILKLIKKATKI